MKRDEAIEKADWWWCIEIVTREENLKLSDKYRIENPARSVHIPINDILKIYLGEHPEIVVEEESKTVEEEMFDKAYQLGIAHANKINSENYTKAESLWQDLLGVVMINEQGKLLSSEQIADIKDVLKNYKPTKTTNYDNN